MQKSNSFKSQKPVIAIDGTAGSGKGTLAKKLANLIKFDHLRLEPMSAERSSSPLKIYLNLAVAYRQVKGRVCGAC